MHIQGYSYIRKIIEAGTSDIYLISKNDEEYILKLTNPPFGFNNKLLLNEYEFYKKYKFEHIPKLVDFIEKDDRLGLILTKLEGESLHSYIEKHSFISEQDVQNIIEQIANILKKFHDEEIIYRDLKPSNVMYDAVNKKVTLCDFGTSIYDGSVIDNKPLGTIGFAPPEQFDRENLSKEVDTFAIGALAIYLLSGGKSIFTVNKEKLYKNIKSKRLKNMIHLSTHNDINKKYTSIDYLLKDLHTNDFILLMKSLLK